MSESTFIKVHESMLRMQRELMRHVRFHVGIASFWEEMYRKEREIQTLNNIVDKMENKELLPEPMKVERNDGTVVYVCTCGRSKKGVGCDGSHKTKP